MTGSRVATRVPVTSSEIARILLGVGDEKAKVAVVVHVANRLARRRVAKESRRSPCILLRGWGCRVLSEAVEKNEKILQIPFLLLL